MESHHSDKTIANILMYFQHIKNKEVSEINTEERLSSPWNWEV
jgi:hypothetical protein